MKVWNQELVPESGSKNFGIHWQVPGMQPGV